jgi:hypothetical protein
MDALLRRDERIFELARGAAGPVVADLLPAVQEGRESGAFRQVDVAQTLVSAVGLNVIYFVAEPVVEALFGSDPLQPEAVVARREAVVDLLLNGILARGEEPAAEEEA